MRRKIGKALVTGGAGFIGSNLVDALLREGAGVKRVVLASSCAVYGDDPELPKQEHMVVRPQSPYAVQKYTSKMNAGLLAATADKTKRGVFNIGTGQCVTINALWNKISAMAGIDLRPLYAEPRAGDILESVADIGRASAALGYEAVYETGENDFDSDLA